MLSNAAVEWKRRSQIIQKTSVWVLAEQECEQPQNSIDRGQRVGLVLVIQGGVQKRRSRTSIEQQTMERHREWIRAAI